MPMTAAVPVIDVGPLVASTGNREHVAGAIDRACREHGFFYVVNHGVDEKLQRDLDHLSRRFFSQDRATKMEISMDRGGRPGGG